MNCIKKIYINQIEIKKSKFISYFIPITEFEKFHQQLKKKHLKANHIVWAYRKLNEFNQIIENSSDDGEPKGAAGVPTLNCLRGKDLINCAILTIRYFGGIKLGVGGMARAYSKAANSVIEIANIEIYLELIRKNIKIKYSNQSIMEYKLKKANITSIKREFLIDEINYTIEATKEQLDTL